MRSLTAADGAEVVVEGIIEDIDIHQGNTVHAIQCKYHESVANFTMSLIYKPLLQMMGHFQRNPAAGVKYQLYAHCPSENGIRQITRAELVTVLNTANQDLSKLVAAVKGRIDLDAFLARFSLVFGDSLDQLIGSVQDAMVAAGIEQGDIAGFAYPNAIQHVADLSIKHNEQDRRTTKTAVVTLLKNAKSTAISRWTLALKTLKRILDERKKQLRHNLSNNTRRRVLVISPTAATDFDEGVVTFIDDFLDKYHSKPNQTETPVVCLDCTFDQFDDLRQRMARKGLDFNDGHIGTQFYPDRLNRKPIVKVERGEIVARDFAFRLLRFDVATTPAILNAGPKCDDLFIVGRGPYSELDQQDMCVEHLATTTVQQVKYLLGIGDAFE
jgi:hypothetical protein